MSSRIFIQPTVQIALGCLLLTLCFEILVRRILRRQAQQRAATGDKDKAASGEWLAAAVGPLSVLMWFYGFYAAAWLLVREFASENLTRVEYILGRVAGAGAFIAGVWFFVRISRLVDVRLQAKAARSDSRIDDVFLPLLGSVLRLVVPAFALFFLLRLWPLDDQTVGVLRKAIAVVMIVSVAWLLRKAVMLAEKALLGHRNPKDIASMEDRALVTRVSVLRKIAVILITVFSLAAVLMLFDEVRDIGRSIIASAGVAGIIIGFAAQRSIASLFAGLQIALTQPIRIGDQVKVQDEVGFVEEITLTYVVVRIWDLRRLVVPINYFIENSVQNWTRNSTDLLSPVTLKVDYSMPVQPFREYMQRTIKETKAWDGKVFAVQATGLDDRSMELRILGSAASAGASFELQCFLREKAIAYVHRHYPQCLPKAREEGRPTASWKDSEEFGPREIGELNGHDLEPENGSAPSLDAPVVRGRS